MSDSLNKQMNEIREQSIAALQRFRSKVTEEELKVLIGDAVSALLVNDEMIIFYASPPLEAMFGYYTSGLQGVPLAKLIPERFHQAHAGHTAGYLEQPRQRAMGDFKGPLVGVKADGTEFGVSIELIPRKLNGEQYVIAQIATLPE